MPRIDEWKSITESAAAVGRSRQTIWRMVRDGRLEAKPGQSTGYMTRLVHLPTLRRIVQNGRKKNRQTA